jgi:hypothetical protein
MGIHPVTVRKWEAGMAPIPKPMARLIRYVVAETKGKRSRTRKRR